MANIKAAQSGNWSSTSTWSGGVVPGPGDTAFANTFTVTVDTNVTVDAVSNAANAGISAAAGGFFSISNSGVTLTISGGILATNIGAASGLVRFSHATGTSSLVISSGSIVGGNSGNYHAVVHSGAGTVNITGDVSSGGGNTIYGVQNTSTGTINITGNISSSGGSGQFGVVNSSTGAINVTGNVTGGNGSGYGIVNGSTGTLTVNGTVTGGASGGHAIYVSTSSSVNTINGNVNGGSGVGIYLAGAAYLTVNGNVTAGTTHGITNNANAYVAVTGSVSASSTGFGIYDVNLNGTTRIGASGQTSVLTSVGKVQAISGPWMAVAGAKISMVIPTDSAYPAYSGTTETLSIEGFTMGDGLILLDDIAAVVGAQIAAATSA